METVFTMLDWTTLKTFWMERKLFGQLIFSPAMMPFVCRLVVSTCRQQLLQLKQLKLLAAYH